MEHLNIKYNKISSRACVRYLSIYTLDRTPNPEQGASSKTLSAFIPLSAWYGTQFKFSFLENDPNLCSKKIPY